MEQARFLEAVDQIMDHARDENGIGTLGEKTIHAVLKQYYSPDPSCLERRVLGYVADIFTGSEIIEIQTRNFNTLRRKLDVFLPAYKVTIVYPAARIKWLRWIDPGSGAISPKRKSPKAGSPFAVMPELYRIKPYLTHPNLHLCIAMLDVEEYRLLDGFGRDKKKGSHRNDAYPAALAEEVRIDGMQDYSCFLPPGLPGRFTVKEYQALLKLPKKTAGTALHILNYVGAVAQVGKAGRAYLYQIAPGCPKADESFVVKPSVLC